jgi:hypothetical protein
MKLHELNQLKVAKAPKRIVEVLVLHRKKCW